MRLILNLSDRMYRELAEAAQATHALGTAEYCSVEEFAKQCIEVVLAERRAERRAERLGITS